jgi:hypothetical protein
VLADETIEPAQRELFMLLPALWRGAVADRNAASEPEVDAEGLIRASPSVEFYAQACERGFAAACPREQLAQLVINCSRGRSKPCLEASKQVAKLSEFPQAFPSELTLLAKACTHGSEPACAALVDHPDRAKLEPQLVKALCAARSLEPLCPTPL